MDDFYNLTCCISSALKKTSQVSRRKKENNRKARNRKRERDESAAQSLLLQLVDEYKFNNICFPEGYSSSMNSQHALCEEEINVDVLENLSKRSSVKVLEHLISQGCFSLDALQTVEHTMERLECQ